MKNLIMMMILISITGNLQASNLEVNVIIGKWSGILEVQGTELSLIFHVSEEGEGYTTVMDSPDQGAMGIPTTSTTFEDQVLTISAEDMKLKFVGKLTEDGETIKGTFNQGAMSVPLELTKGEVEIKKVVRPQDPIDMPYQVEEVRFKNPKGGHHLSGTLTMPENGDFEKVVVLISGSGPQNRDEEMVGFNHRPFLVLSDYLTRNGIAVLRHDDRGVGESEGTQKGATTEDFATDTEAAVKYLTQRADMKGKVIGLAGHSEGGMIAPMVSVGNEDVDFVALLAGPGTKITELMVQQAEKIGLAEGQPEELVRTNVDVLEKVYSYMSENKLVGKDALEKGILEIFHESLDLYPEEVTNSIENKDSLFKEQADALLDDWFLYFINYDPAIYLSKVKVPVLAINGALDLQVPADENLNAIEEALKAGGNQQFTIRKFEQQNHLFQVAETGAPSEYSTIEETFNKGTMSYIADWINGLNK